MAWTRSTLPSRTGLINGLAWLTWALSWLGL